MMCDQIKGVAESLLEVVAPLGSKGWPLPSNAPAEHGHVVWLLAKARVLADQADDREAEMVLHFAAGAACGLGLVTFGDLQRLGLISVAP